MSPFQLADRIELRSCNSSVPIVVIADYSAPKEQWVVSIDQMWWPDSDESKPAVPVSFPCKSWAEVEERIGWIAERYFM